MTNGKCYSTPPKPAAVVSDATSKRIDEAFEKAYRKVYMDQDSPSEGKQLIEDAYQRKMQRLREGSKDNSGMFHHPEEAERRAKAAAEFKMPHEQEISPYERYMQRKRNAWKEGK